MKLSSLSDHLSWNRPFHRRVLLVVFLLAVSGSTLPAAESAAPAADLKLEPAPGDYRNWFDVSVGGLFINKNRAQYQQRYGRPAEAFGGVEEFHYEQDVGQAGLFTLDGRGIFDNEDYSIKLELADPDIGYLRAGYKEFRTYYDGSGGFFPLTGAWLPLYDDALALDRGEAFLEAGLTLPDRPQVTLSYRHLFRDGRKDSLVWGDSAQPGLPGSTSLRGIAPSFWDLNEQRHIVTADVRHAVGRHDLGVGVRYEVQNNENSRNIRRRAGESSDRFLTHREGIESDLFNAHAFTQTRFNEKLLLTTGYSVTTLDSDLSGSRIYGADYDPVYDPAFARRQFRDEGYLSLSGGSRLRQYVLNLNLMITPWEHVAIVPSVRLEKQDLSSVSDFLETNVGSPPLLTSVQEELAADSERDLLDVSEALEVRYTGWTNWVLYARGNWLQGEGDQHEREIAVQTGSLELFRDTDFDRFTQKYTIGANWYPLRRLSFAGQYYHKIRDDEFDHRDDSTVNTTGNRYPAFLTGNNFETDDVNFRMTWRPFSQLTSVSRYDFQLSTIEMEGAGLRAVESSEVTSHILSQSLTWSPLARLYLQGSINYVWDETDTPTDELTGTVTDFENNYWNASALAGYALTDRTDLQTQYFYYRADNYKNNALFSQPYGSDARENGITASIIHRVRRNLQWTLKYGFFSGRFRDSGGFNDYDAHLIYSSMRCWF